MTGWSKSPLGPLVAPVNSWNPLQSPETDEFIYIDLGAVDQESKSIVGSRKLRCSEAPSRARQLVKAGDILVSTVRPNLNGVARVPEHLAGATASTGFCVLRPKDTLNGAYLFHWVKSPEFRADMVSKASGASYPAVSDRIIFGSSMPYPEIGEQHRIAEILDQADALCAQRRTALAEVDTLTQAIFLHLFGDLNSDALPWRRVSVAETCSRITVGIVVQPASYYRLEGIPALRSLNVRAGYISLADLVQIDEEANATTLAKSRIWEGDVVIVRSGQPGTAAVVPACLHGANSIDILIATPDLRVIHPLYLCTLLNSSIGKQLVLGEQRGQIQKHLNVGSLKASKIPLPPLDLQREFAKRVDEVEKLKAAHQASLAELDALFASLQHRAFRGEL